MTARLARSVVGLAVVLMLASLGLFSAFARGGALRVGVDGGQGLRVGVGVLRFLTPPRARVRARAGRSPSSRSRPTSRCHHASRRSRRRSSRLPRSSRSLHCSTSRRSAHRRVRHTVPAASPSTPSSAGGGASSSSTTTAPSGPAGSPATGTGGSLRAPISDVPPAEVSPGESGPAHVQVLAKEYSFTLSRTEVPAGKVVVEFVNGGEDPHNLHLEEPTAGSEAGSFPTSAPKTHADITLELKAGAYTLFCSLPEHEAKGMKATLTVR